jgi:hypothetical protein
MSFVLMAAAQNTGTMSTAPTPPSPTPVFVIRPATVDDVAAVRRIATLDSAPVPPGDLLLGVVDGTPLAALSIDDPATVVADPFHPTAELVEMLRMRADRLRSARAGGLAGGSRSWLRVGRRRVA